MEVLEERIVMLNDVEELLRERYNKGELNEFQKKAYEHAKKMIKLPKEKAYEMLRELEELNEKEIKRLKEEDLVKIVEIMPLSIDELKAVLLQSKVDLKRAELEKILEVVKKYEKEARASNT